MGISIESTGCTRMPLYACKDAIAKFNEDAKGYPFWVVKFSKSYDPEGLNIQDKDGKIQYAGTEQECLNWIQNKIRAVEKEQEKPFYLRDMCIETKTRDAVCIYYPHAISKATFLVLYNGNYREV